MSDLERKIDELYTLPLTAFTAARNALAKTVKGDDAARVKGLEKPSVVAWGVNQLYWTERRTFDRLMASGHHLRTAQIAALKGKPSELRDATTTHRSALGAAVSAATRIAGGSGVRPAADPLARMLEALSLAPAPPGSPGRFTDVVQPAGFEALAGITPVAPATPTHRRAAPTAAVPGRTAPKRDAAADRRRAVEEAAATKAAEGAHRKAQETLERARASEALAQTQVDSVRQQLVRAESALTAAKLKVQTAEQGAAIAEADLERLAPKQSTPRG